MKKVRDEYGNEVIIDDTTKQVYTYNNKNKTITYNANIIVDSKPTGRFVNYTEKGIVTDIEERLQVWNNKLLLAYTIAVDFNRENNDSDNKKWNELVSFVKENEGLFFTKKGDFRKKFLIPVEEIRNLLEHVR